MTNWKEEIPVLSTTKGVVQVICGLAIFLTIIGMNLFILSMMIGAIALMDSDHWPGVIIVFQIYVTGFLTGHLIKIIREEIKDFKRRINARSNT